MNLTLNYIRDRRRLVPLAEHSSKFSNFPSRENISNPDSDLERKIEIAINSLPAGSEAVFVLKHYERQSYKEISKTLKIPVGTVMSRLNRAREKLKSALFPYLKGGLNIKEIDSLSSKPFHEPEDNYWSSFAERVKIRIFEREKEGLSKKRLSLFFRPYFMRLTAAMALIILIAILSIFLLRV